MLIHTKEKIFTCNICGYKSKQKQNLIRHSAKVHNVNVQGKKKLQCSCPNCRIDDNERGKKIVDPKIKRLHYCENCGKIFEYPSNLANHVKSHTDERPFVCKWPSCFKKFKHKYDFNRHMLVHNGEKNFKCDYCEYKTAIKSHLKNHIKVHEKASSRINFKRQNPLYQSEEAEHQQHPEDPEQKKEQYFDQNQSNQWWLDDSEKFVSDVIEPEIEIHDIKIELQKDYESIDYQKLQQDFDQLSERQLDEPGEHQLQQMYQRSSPKDSKNSSSFKIQLEIQDVKIEPKLEFLDDRDF